MVLTIVDAGLAAELDERGPGIVGPVLTSGEWLDAATVRGIDRVAVAARTGSQEATTTLLLMFGPVLNRMADRQWRRAAGGRIGGAWDRDDLRQEAGLLLIRLVRGWQGEGPFGPYALAVLPRRLGEVVAGWRTQDLAGRRVAGRLEVRRPGNGAAAEPGADGTLGRPRAAADAARWADGAGVFGLDCAGGWLGGETVEAADARLLLAELVERLPEELRAVALMRVLEGWSHRRVAEATGVSVRTARRRWHAARMAMAELLDRAGVRPG